jgi:translin
MNIETLVEGITAQLDATNQAREAAITTSRSLTRQCANAIRAAHRHEWEAAQALVADAEASARTLRTRLTDHPNLLFAGYTQDALKEYAEARLLYAMIHGDALPTAAEIAVEPAAYLNGMAEAASELRRYILDGLRSGDVETGERLLTIMDDVYSLLITVDYPDAVTGGLRRTTDALRGVVERTRGDLTTAVRQEQLMIALSKLEG